MQGIKAASPPTSSSALPTLPHRMHTAPPELVSAQPRPCFSTCMHACVCVCSMRVHVRDPNKSDGQESRNLCEGETHMGRMAAETRTRTEYTQHTQRKHTEHILHTQHTHRRTQVQMRTHI